MLVYSLTPSVTSEQKRSSALEQRSTPSRFQSAVRIYTTELSLVKDWAKLTVDDKTSSLKRKTSELRKISNVRSNFVFLLVMSRGFEVVTGAKALSCRSPAPDSQCWDYGHIPTTPPSPPLSFSFCYVGDGAKALFTQTMYYY